MKVYLKTYGCQMNVYDSEKIVDHLKQAYAASLTDDPHEADLVILNTCSIREKAQEKVFSEIGQWREHKAARPQLLIGVTGCVASQEGEALIKRAPLVDFVLGPQTIHRIVETIDYCRQEKKAKVDVSFPAIEKFQKQAKSHSNKPAAYVSIMEGCNKFCSFCIVPYTRGEEISRPFKDVIREVKRLVDQGVKEIHLLGQNVNDYYGALDWGTGDLALLIHYVAAIDGVERIRFTTSHPNAFTQELADVFHEEPKLVSHIHFPVQSGSDRILQAMKRGYTHEEYLEKVAAIRAARPGIVFSSDFIVGFPGETEADFQDTLALVKQVNFDTSFSFIYSPRPGTPASELIDNTSMAEKKERLARLQDLLTEQASEHAQATLDKTLPVLVEGYDKKYGKLLLGRTECNRSVLFDGPETWIGEMVEVTITHVMQHSLRGRSHNPHNENDNEKEFYEETTAET